MINKSTLQLSSIEDKEIIGIAPTSNSYIDEVFFRKYFKEKQEGDTDTNFKTYAVKIQCVRADWIINDDVHGFEFLSELVKKKN